MPPPADELRRPLERLPDPLPIPPLPPPQTPSGGRRIQIRPPGSKSLTNRALLLAALGAGRSEIRRPLLGADDSDRMMMALRALGARIAVGGNALTVEGVGGRWRPEGAEGAEVRLNLGNAGTATRFLAAAALLSPAPVVIDGDDRMRQRPIAELAAALRALGATVDELGAPGCPPLRITPGAGPEAGLVELGPTTSSQFISAMLLVAPWLPGGLTLRLRGEITSRSYVEMTVGLLDRLGASVRLADELRVIRIGPAPGSPGLDPFSLEIEPDASGATALWAAAAITPGLTVHVPGLGADSLQGDARFPEILARMGATLGPDNAVTGAGALRPLACDMRDMPDAAMALVAACALAPGRSVIRGLKTLRVKETDRLAALQRELGKIGVAVELDVEGETGAIAIVPPEGGGAAPAGGASPKAPEVIFDTYNDHRMAMALALIGLRRPGVSVRDPGCVRKTYPAFWQDLARLY